jgi:hypothetical protein
MDSIKIFNKFVDFVNDLHEVFGTHMKSLKMYHVLVTSLQEKYKENAEKYADQVETHVKKVSEFIFANKEAIIQQDVNLIVQKNLAYSERIYIDFELVLRHAEEKSAIWKHLLFLYSLFDPDSNAKNVLNKFLDEDTPENNIIKNIASKLEDSNITQQFSNTSNPMEMMSMLNSSGLMSSIMGSMNPDSLSQVDPKKLIKTMRSMLDTIASQIDEEDSKK